MKAPIRRLLQSDNIDFDVFSSYLAVYLFFDGCSLLFREVFFFCQIHLFKTLQPFNDPN